MLKTSASISVQFDNPFSPFAGADWKKGFAWVKASGFDAVEIILSAPQMLNTDEILAELEKHELPVSTISTGQAMGMEGIELCAMSEAVREHAHKRLVEDIDFAVRVGRANVTIGLIRGRGGKLSAALEMDLLRRELCSLGEYALKQGVKLNLEPINRYECKCINSTEDGYRFLAHMGLPENIGILYDTFHSNIEDADMFAAVTAYAPQISHVHFADSNRRLPGEGHIDFPRLCRTLEQANYQGYVSLEVLNHPNAEHIIQYAGEAVRRAVCTK